MPRLASALLLTALAGVVAAAPVARLTALPPLNTTTPAPPTLLLIPMHASEPASNLRDLIACALSPGVAPSVTGERFTILLVLSGASPDPRRAHELGGVLRTAAAALPSPSPRVQVTSVALGATRDAYDRAAADTGAAWVSGPNSLFYDTLLPNGTVHARFVMGHTFVQQLETDVCATRAGWLDTLLTTARAAPGALVVGATLAGDCVWVAEHAECELVAGRGDDGVLVSHVNGNALYRAGSDLTLLLTLARDALGSTQPL